MYRHNIGRYAGMPAETPAESFSSHYVNSDARRSHIERQCIKRVVSIRGKGAITSKIKHAIKLKTGAARLAQLLHNTVAALISILF